MAYNYTIPVTVRGGKRSIWDSVWDGSSAESELRVGLTGTSTYHQCSYMFDASSVSGKTITAVKLTLTVVSGTIPSSGTNNFPIYKKANSSTTSWTNDGGSPLAYIKSTGESYGASNTSLTFSMGSSLPTYGYVAGSIKSPSGSYKNLIMGSSASLTVTTNEVTVSYNKGANGTGTNSSVVGYPVTLKGATFTRTGYTQTGWSTTDGGAKAYNLGASYSGSSDLTLYPFWTINTYTVSYNANGGSGAPSAQTKTYGVNLTLSSTKPTRANSSAGSFTLTYDANGGSVSPTSAAAAITNIYSFSHWNTAAGGGGTSYQPGGTYAANAAATLYAQWSVAQSVAWVTLPTPTRTGYTCNGWYTAASGGTKVANAGAAILPTASRTLYAQWTANVVAPTFTTQPSSKSVYRGASASLSVVATTTQGTITYQWQSSTNNSSFSNISGATSASYSAPTSTVGTMYYRCVATSTKDGVSKSTTSNSCSVAVSATPTPTITTQPASKSVAYNGTVSLSVAATGNSLSYQWQSSSDNSSWSNISGATSSSYSAPTTTYGTKYYRCVVTNTLNGYTASTNSSAASVTVGITAPTFTTQPTGGTVYRGATKTMTVAATAPYGTITYQWQSSSNNTSWSNISGATSTSYTAPTSSVGTVYYRCVATATHSGVSGTATSNSVSVVVSATPAPTITKNPADASAFVGETKSVFVTASGNSLSYQWQKSSNNSTWSNISGATSVSYTYPTSSTGTTYYRCVVTNTLNGYTATANSSAATITVVDVTPPTFTKSPVSATYYIGTSSTALSVTATSNATITYQWQSSTNNSTWTNISGATSATYTPPTSSAGTMYYRCVATATGGSQAKSTNSSSAFITIYQASAPTFTNDLSLIDVTYDAADQATALDGTATAPHGTITYQWYKSGDNATWAPIYDETSAMFTPPTNVGGIAYYRVVATNHVGTSEVSATSGSAKVTIQNVVLDYDAKWAQYLKAIGKPFVKLARLDFLNPNGSVLYTLDNNPHNDKSKAFIQSGELTVNLQNGMRRNATVTLTNLNGDFDYNVNKLWFGQQVRLWEGLVLPNGEDFYISQGVFYVKDPDEVFEPNVKQTTLHLVDKWAYLDGTLFGNLDGTYEIPVNSNIFNAIASVLAFDRGNGQAVDSSAPIFTDYYNGKTTTLPDGTTVPLTNTPYTYRCDGENGNYADIILEMNTMLAGWIGYDANGQLRLDPSQDDILDTTKPIQWRFSTTNSTFLGATYTVKNSEVYNDIIIVGESLSDYGQTSGRATNYDPRSDTNANIIGLKTKRYQQSGYYTQDICESLAVFKLKRESVLKKSVSIKCSQMFHIQENNLVTIERTDKYGNPIERHLVTGYSRPIAQSGEMTINATSCNDYPVATITTAP